MYKIELSRTVNKSIEDIYRSDRKLCARILTAIESLAEDPFIGKKLKGPLKGDYSLRVGSYRIIYSVYKEKLIICIIDLGHRKGIYK